MALGFLGYNFVRQVLFDYSINQVMLESTKRWSHGAFSVEPVLALRLREGVIQPCSRLSHAGSHKARG